MSPRARVTPRKGRVPPIGTLCFVRRTPWLNDKGWWAVRCGVRFREFATRRECRAFVAKWNRAALRRRGGAS